MHPDPGVNRITRLGPADRRAAGLAELETLAWILDNSIRVPGTGGRRFGLDAVIGFVPVVGDLLSGGIGLFVVWRAARLDLPRVVVARMLTNSAIDFVVGAIPFVGDAFDLWFKANSRNLALMRRHLEEPDAPTRGLWVSVGAVALAIGAVLAAVVWAMVSLVGVLLTPI